MLLTAIAIALIGAGTALTYFFAMTAYNIIENPQEVKLLPFIISKIPPTTEPYTLSGDLDGTDFSLSIPYEISIFVLVYLGLIALRVVSSIAIDLIKGGTKLISSIWEQPKKKPPHP